MTAAKPDAQYTRRSRRRHPAANPCFRQPADEPFQRGDARFVDFDRIGGDCLVVEGASLKLLDPDPDQVA